MNTLNLLTTSLFLSLISTTTQAQSLDTNTDNCTDDSPQALIWYQDKDRDGFGNSKASQKKCNQPDGYTIQKGDCDDDTAKIHPMALETCDNTDNNCNGEIDENFVLPVEVHKNNCIEKKSAQCKDGLIYYAKKPIPNSALLCQKYIPFSCDPKSGQFETTPLTASDAPEIYKKNKCIDQSTLKCSADKDQVTWDYDYKNRGGGYEMQNDNCVAIRCKNGKNLVHTFCSTGEDGDIRCEDTNGNSLQTEFEFLPPVTLTTANGAHLYFLLQTGSLIQVDFKKEKNKMSFILSSEKFTNASDIHVTDKNNLLILKDGSLFKIGMDGESTEIELETGKDKNKFAKVDKRIFTIKEGQILEKGKEKKKRSLYICPTEKVEFDESKVAFCQNGQIAPIDDSCL